MATYSVYFKPTDTALTPIFVKFIERTTGINHIGSAPAITPVDVLGFPGTNFGEYKFTFLATVDISFVVDGGAALPATDRYQRGVIGPDDDLLAAIKADTQRIKVLKEGRWKMFSTGPDANRVVQYDTDNSTPIQKWDLRDILGSPTITSITERIPVLSIP
jgi:hypothetical protein